MCKLLKKLLMVLFPPYEFILANRKIDLKIAALESNEVKLVYMDGYTSFPFEDIEKYLGKTLEVKKTLEDKAKTNVLGVTISVSLIIGLSQLFSSNLTDVPIVRTIMVILAIYSLGSMITATVITLAILGKHNQFYDLTLLDRLDSEENQKTMLAYNIEKNMNCNIKRNNMLYVSYKLIVIFLTSISLLFGMSVLSSSSNTKSTIQKLEIIQVKMSDQIDEQTEKISILNKALINDSNKIIELRNQVAECNGRIEQLEPPQDRYIDEKSPAK